MECACVGIDAGVSGAIALLLNGEFSNVWDMPIEAKAHKGHRVDCYELVDIAARICRAASGVPLVVALESVGAMPKQGVSTMFSLGDSFGTARCFAAIIGGTLLLTPSNQWKSKMKLTKNKDYSLTVARRLFPNARDKLTLKKHHGRAEALLLARFAHDHAEK